MVYISKKLILDLVRLSSICYCKSNDVDMDYTSKRPYNKLDNACVFNTLRECPKFLKS